MLDDRPDAAFIDHCVHFKPGGAFPFLGAPAIELTDIHLDLESLWGGAAAELRERLRAATTVGERFSLLEHALVSRLRYCATALCLSRWQRSIVRAGEHAFTT
jgi:hypothetical protein